MRESWAQIIVVGRKVKTDYLFWNGWNNVLTYNMYRITFLLRDTIYLKYEKEQF